MKLYVIPPGRADLNGEIFKAHPPFPPMLDGEFTGFFREKGYEAATIDAWRPDAHEDSDALLVLNHPEDGWLQSALFFFKFTLRGRGRFSVDRREFRQAMRKFSKKVLYQIETPVYTPYPHRRLGRLSKMYGAVLLYRKAETDLPNVRYLMHPRDFRGDYPELHRIPKARFLAMVNNNTRPQGFFRNELLSERLRAIRHFGRKPDFDLYGGRWERGPFFPFWGWKKSILRSWRGRIPGDKLAKLAEYKFALAIENCEFPGYVSEKIFDCFLAGSVPLYLGAPDIGDHVPENCFINLRKFGSYAEAEEHIRNLGEDDLERYRANAREYLEAEREGIFSKRAFAEGIWREINGLKG